MARSIGCGQGWSRPWGQGSLRSISRIACFVAAVGVVAGCASFRVSTDFDPSFAFSELRTFAWLPDANPPQDTRLHNSLVDGRIRAAVERQLTAGGYRLVAPGEADFLVSHHVGLETGFDVQTIHTSHRYARSSWHVGGTTRTVVREYERGTLMIDVLLPERRSLLWRGSTSSRIRGSSDPERREQRINDAVEAILKRFPPS